ncbi:MAG TPA: TadE/TadG family type IV pilus assembly protein [Gemmataceae bacterium]|nr:TadE/TadG family type IV pilus assembly protein [Gemmataceae bacterium]
MKVHRPKNAIRRAVSVVEFALVAPIFFIVVMGLIEIGRACMVTELLTEAARRGCRAGVIEGTSTSSIQKTATDYLAAVGISGESADVYVNDAPAGSTNVQGMPAYTEITVVVTVPINNVTWTPIRWVNNGLSGQYTMRRE